jgi:hypothetical protein
MNLCGPTSRQTPAILPVGWSLMVTPKVSTYGEVSLTFSCHRFFGAVR